MLVPSVSKLFIVINFKLNQAAIAKNLCENRGKIDTSCQGNCYLTKQLKKAEEKEQKQVPNSLKEKVELTLFLDSNTWDNTTYTIADNADLYCSYLQNYYFAYNTDFFHPPRV